MGTSRVLNPRYWCQYLILVSVPGPDIGIGICASLVLHIRQILSHIPQIFQTVKNTNSKVRVWQKWSPLLSTFREHPCVLVYERKELMRFRSSLLNVQWKLWHCIYVYYSHWSRDVLDDLAYFTRSAFGLSAFKISDLTVWFFLEPLFPNVNDVLRWKISVQVHVSTLVKKTTFAVWWFYEL